MLKLRRDEVKIQKTFEPETGRGQNSKNNLKLRRKKSENAEMNQR